MKDVVVVNKETLEKNIFNEDQLSLNSASIIHLKIKKDDVAEFIQQGNTLIIKLKNGEILVLEKFFEKNKENVASDLVFEDDACDFLWFNYENGVVGFKSITGLEELLPVISSSVFSGMTPWLLGGAALAGGIAAGAGGGSSSSANNESVPAPQVKITSVNPAASTPTSKESGAVISGTATPNSKVVVTANGEIVGEVESDENGNWEIPSSKQISELENVYVEIPSNNQSNPQAQDSMQIPYIGINPIALDDKINLEESLSNNGYTSLSGVWIYPEHIDADIKISINGQVFTPDNGLVISADGAWSLDLPTSLFNEGGDNKVTAEIFNNENVPNIATREVVLDTILDQPKIVISEQGVIQIVHPHDQGELNIDTSEIKIYDSFGVKQKVEFSKSEDGKILTAQLPEGLLGDIKVVVPQGSYVDWVGNIGTEVTASAKVDTDIPVVKITIRENGEIVLTYPKDVDTTKIDISKVQVYNNYGTIIPQLNFVLKPDGSYQAQIPSGYNDNIKVFVPAESYSDLTGNRGTDVLNEAVVDTKNPTVDIDIAKPNHTGETTVKFTFSEKIDPESFNASDIQVKNGTLDPKSLVQISDHEWQANVSSVPGTTLTVGVKDKSYTDIVGNEGADHSEKLITISIDTLIPKGNNQTSIIGKTEPNQKVEVTLPNGEKQTTTSLVDGSWSIVVNDSTLTGGDLTAKTPGIQTNNWVTDTKQLPFVSIDIVAANDVIELDELQQLKTLDDNQLNQGLDITGHVINPQKNGLLVVKVDGVEYVQGAINPQGDLTVNADGTWSLHIYDNTEVLDRLNVIQDPNVIDKKAFNVEAYIIESEEVPTLISNLAERHISVEHEVDKPVISFKNGEIIVQFGDNVDLSEDYSDLIHITDKQDTSEEKYSNIKFTKDPSDSSRYIAQMPDNQNFDLDVKVDPEYKNVYGDKGEQVISTVYIDTVPPEVDIDIDLDGHIQVAFDTDVNISTIDWSLVNVEINGSKFEFNGKTNIVDGVETITFEGFVDSKKVEIELSNTNNQYVFEAKVDGKNGIEILVSVPNDAFEDEYSNKGKGTSEQQIIYKQPPIVEVDYLPEQSGQNGVEVFKISFSEEVVFDRGEGDISDQLQQYIQSFGIGVKGVISVEKISNNDYLVKVTAKETNIIEESSPIQDTVIITIPSHIYVDVYGNSGANTSADSSKGKNTHVGYLQESGIDTDNYVVNGISQIILEQTTTEANITQIVSNNTYGEIKYEDGKLKFILDNSKETTQALTKNEKVTQDYQYTIIKDEVETIHVGTVIITGSNDAPIIEQTKARVLTPIEGSFSFENSTISNPTVVNSTLKSEHLMGFELKAEDLLTTQIYINLKKLDNSFKIEINGKSIHLNDVFQIEAGDKTTPIQVPLLFADGTWLASGSPWNVNDYGLPRFQIIISDSGIRFFGTKTSKSQYLEEIFYDQKYANGLQSPEFVVGKNTLNIINVDGIGVDAMVGEVTITAGGKFHISDIDSEKLNGIEVRISNYIKGDTFVPVLPKGITYTSMVEGNELVLKISADQSTDATAQALKVDYEDVLNSLMFKGTADGSKNITVKVLDDFNAYDLITGTLDYKKDEGTVKLTQIEFKESSDPILNILQNIPEDIDVSIVEDQFILGSSQVIDVSSLLNDSANKTNLQDYIFVEYDEVKDTATILIDRDGKDLTAYQKQELFVLTNQKQAFDLEDLLANNQIVY